MDRKVKSFRLRTDLLAWVESYAASRGSTQVAVLETALSNLKSLSEGGVPDLEEGPPASPSREEQIANKHALAQARAAVATGETYADIMRTRQMNLNKRGGS